MEIFMQQSLKYGPSIILIKSVTLNYFKSKILTFNYSIFIQVSFFIQTKRHKRDK
jgi:hypothetical protein